MKCAGTNVTELKFAKTEYRVFLKSMILIVILLSHPLDQHFLIAEYHSGKIIDIMHHFILCIDMVMGDVRPVEFLYIQYFFCQSFYV